MDEKLVALESFTKKNNRVCPQPHLWNKLWKMLPGRKRSNGGWHPPLPLILKAWWHTSDEHKRERLMEHLTYAHESGALSKVERFLRSLKEDDWHHEGE